MTARPPPLQRRLAGIRSSPACPRRPLTFRSEGETMIRTPLYAALLVALSQPAFAQSPGAPRQPRAEPVPASAPVDDAPATADRDCRGQQAGSRQARAGEVDDGCIEAVAPIPGSGTGSRLPPRAAARSEEHTSEL